MDRTTEDIVALVLPKFIEHYKYIHLDLDVPFVYSVAFFLAKSKDIGCIHCKTILTMSDKQVMNRLKSIVLDYEAIKFKFTTTFTDGAFKFKLMINWMRHILHIYLTTFATDLNAPRAKNAIKFIKEIVRCIQSESTFTRYPKWLTTEVVKSAIILMNSFNRKSRVHSVMSHRQILF